MTIATTQHPAARALDPRSLRDDLRVLRRVISHPNQSSPAAVARNLDMARHIARHWAPVAHARRAAADGLLSEEQRWDALLACADPERAMELSYAAVVVYAGSVRELVQALHEDIRLGTTVPEVSRAITAAISQGEFPVGRELRVKQVATALRAPVETVRTAVDNLLGSGALEKRSRRIFPAGSLVLATHIADRLRAQIAAGIYMPGSRLPGIKVLASTFYCDYALVRQVLRILAAEGVVLVASREVLQAAAPLLSRPVPTPPHHDERTFRFSRDTIVATCRAAHEQWRRRSPAPEELLHARWEDLRFMAGQLLAAAPNPAPDATQDLADLARTAELASARLPDKPWLQQWHTACLAKEVSNVLPLIPKEPR